MDNISNKNSEEDIFQRTIKLPDFVQEAMSNIENAKINAEIRDKYKLNEDQFSYLLHILLRVFVKDISLETFPKTVKEDLEIDDDLAKKISLEIAQKRFFPLREHLIGTEKLIKNLGGEIPKDVPKFKSTLDPEKPKVKRYSIFPEKQKTAPKDIKSALKENEKLENQLVGKKAIKIASSEVSVKPSIKNWLADYEKTLGAGFHSNIERVNYLYQSKNAKKLLPHERENLGLILKSFDENSTLPISTKNGLMIFPFKPPAEALPKEEIKKPKSSTKKTARKNSKKKQEKKYQDIEAAPEKTTRTMREDIKNIFKDK